MSQFTEADSSVNRLNAAVTAFEKVLTEPEGTVVEMPIGAAQPSLAERLKRAVDAVTVKPAQAAAQASAAAQQAQAAQQSAAQSAADAANSAAATGYVDAPFPDVWAPLSDDLRLLAGIAPADTITVAGTSYPLPTKSMTFTRSTTATYIDKSGILQTAAINEPRFEKEGLLIEGQGTNLVSNSQSTSAWRVANSTVTQAAVISPDGTATGVTKLASAGGANTQTGAAISVPISGLSAGGYCSFSVFAKADSHNLIQLRWLGGTTGVSNRYLNVDLSTGEIGANNLFYAKAISMANGWWRIMAVTSIDGDLTGNTSADPGVELIGSLTDGRRPAVSLATGVGVYLYGPQLESGLSSSYIPTSGTVTTRANETGALQAAGNCGYNLTGDLFERTVAFELSVNVFSAPATGYHSAIAVAGAGNDIITRMRTDSLDSLRSANGLSPVIGVTYPFSKKLWIQTIDISNKVTAYFDGKIGVRTAAPANPANAGLSISFASNPNVVYHIRNFRIWHRALTLNQIKGLR